MAAPNQLGAETKNHNTLKIAYHDLLTIAYHYI
jgi:hypothetical protein